MDRVYSYSIGLRSVSIPVLLYREQFHTDSIRFRLRPVSTIDICQEMKPHIAAKGRIS